MIEGSRKKYSCVTSFVSSGVCSPSEQEDNLHVIFRDVVSRVQTLALTLEEGRVGEILYMLSKTFKYIKLQFRADLVDHNEKGTGEGEEAATPTSIDAAGCARPTGGYRACLEGGLHGEDPEPGSSASHSPRRGQDGRHDGRPRGTHNHTPSGEGRCETRGGAVDGIKGHTQ